MFVSCHVATKAALICRTFLRHNDNEIIYETNKIATKRVFTARTAKLAATALQQCQSNSTYLIERFKIGISKCQKCALD